MRGRIRPPMHHDQAPARDDDGRHRGRPADQPVEGVTVVMTVSKYGPGKRPKNAIGDEIYYEVPSRTGPDRKWRTDSVPPGPRRSISS